MSHEETSRLSVVGLADASLSSVDKVADAAADLALTARENGGPYEEPAAYRGSCGRTMFDRPGTEDGTVTILVPEKQISEVFRNAFVRIPSVHPRTGVIEAEYLGSVSAGPFAEPDALAASAPTLVVAAAHGAVLTPKYHGIAQVDVFAERVDGSLVAPTRRPSPNSPVFSLPDGEVAAVLGLNVPEEERPFRLGVLDGANPLPVVVPAAKKSVLFKHTAILGTTGGGKSTTVSGAIGSLAHEGNAVVLFDIEGEYTTINEPAAEPGMVAALRKRRLEAKGTPRTRLFVLAGRQVANPDHPDVRRFKMGFSDISPYVLVEILDLSEAQERRLIDAYDVCRLVMERLRIYPATDSEQQEAADIDELDTGWPRMTLPMVLDVVSAGIHVADGSTDDYSPRSREFKEQKDVVLAVLKQRKPEKDSRSWKAIAKRLWRMHKAGVFSANQSDLLNPNLMLEPGGIAIVDLSDMEAPYLRNLVIAQVLRVLQARQDEMYRQGEVEQRKGRNVVPPVRLNIFIEEAHEFLSVERIKQMPNLFDQVARIARRGRKRYLGLTFVTQLPGHLPDEVFGLVNNWVLHKLTDTNVIDRLRKVVPSVSDANWRSLPNFAPGQALCSFTHLTRPVMVAVDPTPCRLRMVD
jgi:DNA helicase HerA-like ATPase